MAAGEGPAAAADGGEAPGGPCALVGGRSLLRGSPTRPGHVSQRRPRQPLRRQRLRGRPARDSAGWGVASAAKGKGHGGQLGAASGRGRRWLGAVPAGRPAMAASPRAARSGGREREGCWEGERGDEGRSGARLWRSKSATGGRARGQRRASMVEASSRMAATHGVRVAP